MVADVDWEEFADSSTILHMIHLLLELCLFNIQTSQDKTGQVLVNIWFNTHFQSHIDLF